MWDVSVGGANYSALSSLWLLVYSVFVSTGLGLRGFDMLPFLQRLHVQSSSSRSRSISDSLALVCSDRVWSGLVRPAEQSGTLHERDWGRVK
jgi:hypothetical protein